MAKHQRLRRTRRTLGLVSAVVLVGLWAVYLLPAVAGGRATYLIVSGHSMDGTFSSGDIAVMRSHRGYQIGDIIGYEIPADAPGAGHLVIHRIIGGDATNGFITKGDNNDEPDIWKPRGADVRGRLLIRIPAGGNVLGALRTPQGLGLIAGLVAFWVLIGGAEPTETRAPGPLRSRRERPSPAGGVWEAAGRRP